MSYPIVHTRAADGIPIAERAIIYSPLLAAWICQHAPDLFVPVHELRADGSLRHILLVPAAVWQRIGLDVMGVEAEWRHDHEVTP